MIYLSVKTDFSFLKAYGNPKQIIDRAKAIGADCIGIADFGGTWGHIPFWKACKDLKPIFGVQLAVCKTDEKDPRYDLVTLIAKNNEGLRNQYELVSKATKQFYYRPRIFWNQLDLAHNWVIVNKVASENIDQIQSDFYIGVKPESGFMLSLAMSGDNPVVVMPEVLYPTVEDEEAYRVMLSIGTARKVRDIPRADNYMMSEGELKAKFKECGVSDISSWLKSAQIIADGCNANPSVGKNVKPIVEHSLQEYCALGAQKRNIDLSKEPYKSRYEHEMRLIKEKGFEDYFLMITDIVQWAKTKMLVGPARGSSAGSLVCYLTEIVEVNPITYNLMFERFIDINRDDLPDIDIDFPDDKRNQVFDYIQAKYGRDKIARIGTVSLFKPKSAINDVAKSYSIPAWETKQLTEVMINRSGGDARANMAIEDTIEQFEIGKELAKKYPKIMMAAKIEGHARHTGKHAAGIIVADKDVTNYFSVNRREDINIGMLNKYDSEEIGLLKIDALGLKTLSVIEDCCEQVGLSHDFLYNLPTDIEDVFEIFQKDRVAGIFQFEGYAVRSLMRQMGVEEFNDIIALTALARPGPLHCGAANEFIIRRTGAKDWDYDLPQLKAHTSHTYGTIVYQEQVMSITRDLGDMSWQDVSDLRKAMSRSLGEEFFNQYQEKFLKGTRNKGIPDTSALHLWNEMCTFGSWAFNLSHAVSYALLSYWCAYLKKKHPLEFSLSHLKKTQSQDSVIRLLREMLKEGIKITPFDPHISDRNWKIHDGKIYGGFLAIKGVGPVLADKLLAKRAEFNGDKTWIKDLTLSQRTKILAPNNTPWHNLDRLHKKYRVLYDDPENFINDILPKGISGPVVDIDTITEKRGRFCFIGTMKQRNLRDLNETQSLAKRGGRRVNYNEEFLNLVMEDDTSSILCTIDRWKYPDIGKPIMEQEADGKDFLVRGEIKQDGWRKINISKIVRLEND